MKCDLSNKYIYAIILFIVIVFYNSISYCAPVRYIAIKNINNSYLEYINYKMDKDIKKIDLKDLIVFDKYVNIGSPINILFLNEPDFKLIILEKGIARLKNYELAPKNYKEAQDKAKKEGIGGWPKPYKKDESVEPPKKDEPFKPLKSSDSPEKDRFWTTIKLLLWKHLWQGLAILSALGIIGFILNKLWSYVPKKLMERRINVVLIGDGYAGKTALWLRLDDPDIPWEQIEKKTMQPSVEGKRRDTKTIPWGKYELIPNLKDIPSQTPSSIWDQLIKTGMDVIICVLSPAIKRERSSHEMTLNDDEKKYVNIQLGLIKAFIQGGMGSTFTKKPKVIIVFINKFDLFSNHHPEDTSAINIKKDFLNIFKEHIEICNMKGKDLKIPTHILIGSVKQKWNCQKILDLLRHDLYPKK